MRSILIALSLGVAAASVAYAHIADEPAGRAAGILACRTLPNVSLVFGRTRVAACRYEADRSSFAQSYGALLPPPADDRGEAEANLSQMIVWRVITADGESRPGFLDGAFALAGPGATLRGTAVRLEPMIGEAVEGRVVLGASDVQIEIGALQ